MPAEGEPLCGIPTNPADALPFPEMTADDRALVLSVLKEIDIDPADFEELVPQFSANFARLPQFYGNDSEFLRREQQRRIVSAIEWYFARASIEALRKRMTAIDVSFQPVTHDDKEIPSGLAKSVTVK